MASVETRVKTLNESAIAQCALLHIARARFTTTTIDGFSCSAIYSFLPSVRLSLMATGRSVGSTGSVARTCVPPIEKKRACLLDLVGSVD